VLLVVAPRLLEELLSDLLERIDVSVSVWSSLASSSVSCRFDVAVLDQPLPAGVRADRLLRVQPPQTDFMRPVERADTDVVLYAVEDLQHALARLCPPRAIAAAD
jgi:hypothetical protein